MLPARARRTSTRAPLPTQSLTRSTPAGGRLRRASTWSTAAARSGTESTRVPSRSNITRRGKAPSNSRSSSLMLALHLGQFGAHLIDHSLVIRRIENGRAGNKRVSARFGYLPDVRHVQAANDVEADLPPAGVGQRPRLAQLVEGAGDDFLPTETAVDAHQQDHVDLVHHVLQGVQRGCRVEHQPGLGTT